MIRKFDWPLLISCLLLTLIGLIVLHSINFRDPSIDADFNPTIQVVAALLGIAALIVASRIDYRLWLRLAISWYSVGAGLLILLFFIGDAAGGAVRSINLGFFEFQPTEIAKLGVVFLVARIYTLYAEELQRPRYLIYSLIILAIMLGLIIIQPDLGSVLVVAFAWFIMTLMSRVPNVYIFLLIGAGLIAAPFVVAELPNYQQERLQTFMDPTADPQGDGYNVNQAMIAVGSGQLLGRGLGGGTQSQLNFLPSQHTDFIFAVLAEKLGLLGAGLVLVLFGVFFMRAIMIVWRCREWFGVLVGSGIIAIFLFHVIVTVGMNIGVVPVTGLPLPFLAYGGTNLIVSLFMVGVLQSIATHSSELQFRQ